MNLVRRMTKQRSDGVRVWLMITSLAESRSKASQEIKPSSISNLRSKLGTQVWTYIYYCGPVHGDELWTQGLSEGAQR